MSRKLSDTVHDYLRQNYPERVLGWVKDAKWKRVGNMPLSRIDMARRPGGRDMKKVRGIAQAIKDGEEMEPIVLVDTGDKKLKVADGYHRTLAHKHAGKRTIPKAYVAKVQAAEGPWEKQMHDAKLNKSLSETDFKHYTDGHSLDNSDVINAIADKVHEQWVDFAKKVQSEIDPGHAEAWQRMYVPYDELPDEEKEKDRIFARRIVGAILDVLNDTKEIEKSIQRASDQLEEWSAQPASDNGNLLNWAAEVFGDTFTGEMDIDTIQRTADGEKVLISDGRTSFTAFLPTNGPPRLLKGFATSTPTTNSVWAILHDAGYQFKVKDGTANVDGAKVVVKKNRVEVSGNNAEDVFSVIVDGLAQMTPSEDYVPINMKLTDDYFTVKPW